MELFGFKFTRINKDKETSFVPPTNDDGSIVVLPTGGVTASVIDLDNNSKNDTELIERYRNLAMQPEVDDAVKEIVNEAISIDDDNDPIKIKTDALTELGVSSKTKKIISDEFKEILRLLNFNTDGYDIFRKWYIDGRIYYHTIVEEGAEQEGIKEIRYIDPRKIRKVKELKVRKSGMNMALNDNIYVPKNEYFLYSETGFALTDKASSSYNSATAGALKVSKDVIVYVPSGLLDASGSTVISYLHKAIKPMNLLKNLEDATVIFRLTRAPERRLWYIGVGNLPPAQSEKYVRDMMVKHKNKLVYDSNTGEVKDDRKFMTMMEDYWLPRREGATDTEVKTLPGLNSLGSMEEVQYFLKKLYRSLDVPENRMNSESSVYVAGMQTQITRDELKFAKFITRLRSKFNDLFLQLLQKNLILKGIVTVQEWEIIKSRIRFDYVKDNYFDEIRDQELLTNRINTANLLLPLVGKYYSHAYVRKNILRQTEQEIEQEDSTIVNEFNNPIYYPPNPEDPTSALSDKYNNDDKEI